MVSADRENTVSDEYRYIVRVKSMPNRPPYVREVSVDGPQPEDAVADALDSICSEDNDDLWQADTGTIEWERVR